jgi:tetratricopeptide (TPR) repeat protein
MRWENDRMADDRDSRYQYALKAADAARWHDAAAALAPSLRERASQAHMALGAEIALALGAYGEACDFARCAAPGGDIAPRALLRYVRVLRRLELPQALELTLDAHARVNLPADAMAEVALLASSAAQYAQAEHWVAALQGEAPDDPNGHYLAGLLAMFAGRRDASLRALERAVAIEPRMSNAHWLIAMQADASSAETHIAALRHASAGIVPDTEAQAYVGFALHRHLHALGRYDEAWSALESGMRVARRLAPYRPVEAEALFASIAQTRLHDFRPARQPGPDGPRLIFIVGMFRSGTSLVERVLTGHPDVVDGGETFQFTAALREAADYEAVGAVDQHLLALAPRLDFDAVRTRFHDYARWRARGRAWLTEKLPSNFLNIGLIAHAFPDAKIIHLSRDPVATCFSNLRTYFRGVAEYANSPGDFAHYFGLYRALMAHWREALPGRILDVVYEDFVAEPEAGSRRMLDFCGLAFTPNVLNVARHDGHSATASSADVRRGIRTDRGREWEPYRRQLEPIFEYREKDGRA